MSAIGRLEAELYAVGWRAARALPERAAAAVFDRLADAAWLRQGRRVRRLESNLRRVLGPDIKNKDAAEATRLAMRSYCRYWMEVFRLPAMSREAIVGRMRVEDEWRLREAWASRRGVILALPHMGNWDHAGAWCVHTGMPFTTVAEVLEPRSLFDRFVAFRESLGMEVLPLTGGSAPFDVMAQRLRAGGMVCLLADRDLTSHGVDVEFFDATARMPGGPAALTLATGAALLPVTLWYPRSDEPRGWCARIHPEVVPPPGIAHGAQVASMTQSLADAFASGITAHPTDWHMLSRLWVDETAAPGAAVAVLK